MRMFSKMMLVGMTVSMVGSLSFAKDEKAAKLAPGKVDKATWSIDPTASKMGWTGSKITGSSHNGTVAIKNGSIETVGGAITAGSFEIDMKKIENLDLASSPKDAAKLVGHLSSGDFFDVAKYPTSKFVITSVKPITTGGTHQIDGKLTIKDKTQDVSFPATIAIKDKMAEATAQFEIDRTKWDIKYGSGKFFKELGDKVINDPIKFDLKLVAKN